MAVDSTFFKQHKSSEISEFICDYCGKKFKRKVGYVKPNLKNGIAKAYCTDMCGKKGNKKQVTKPCLNCGKNVTRNKFAMKGNVFCSQKCAAIYNNRKYPKRIAEETNCLCGNKKSYGSKTCHKCKLLNSLKKAENIKIKDIKQHSMTRSKHDYIRKWARKKLKLLEVEKKCIFCDYNNTEVLQVAHIKKISKFNDECTVGEINTLDNIKYMCPTHHVEFDKGIKYI